MAGVYWSSRPLGRSVQSAEPADASRSGGRGGAVWETEDRKVSMERGVPGEGPGEGWRGEWGVMGTDAAQGFWRVTFGTHDSELSGVSENAH